MNPKTLKALDRAIERMDRLAKRRRGGFSTAPIMLGLGLTLGYQLLVRFVPMVWASLLPEGLSQVSHLRGWPGLVWRLASLCHANFTIMAAMMAVIVAAGFLVSSRLRPLRFLVWLAAV